MRLNDIAIEQAEYLGYVDVELQDVQNDGRTYVMEALKDVGTKEKPYYAVVNLVAEVGDMNSRTFEDGGVIKFFNIDLFELKDGEPVFVDVIEYEG